MSNKTPYEIRTELLRLAYDICIQKAIAQSNKEQMTADGDVRPTFQTHSPTTDEIIAEAAKLNDFVSSSKSFTGFQSNK